MPDNEEDVEAAVDAVVAECEGNTRAALRVLVVANSYLEAEVARLAETVSYRQPRQDVHRLLARVN